MIKLSNLKNSLIHKSNLSEQNTTKKQIDNPFLAQLQSAIDSWSLKIGIYEQAIAKHSPELLAALKERTDYSDSTKQYFAQIDQLQFHLNKLLNFANTQSINSKAELKQYNKLLEEWSSDIKKNSAEVFQQLNQHIPGLLHIFADVLLGNIEKNESALPIGEIKRAVILDNINLRIQSSVQPAALTELIDTLISLMRSKDLPEEHKAPLFIVLEKISTSPKNIKNFFIFVFNEMAAAQQAAANRIIDQRHELAPAACIDALFEQLNYAFYLPQFTATFNAFIQIGKANQEVIDHIQTWLTALETHCSALKDLLSKYRKELDNLQSNADTETLDGQNKLAQQLTTLTNSLGTGDYFRTVQKEVLHFLTELQKNVKFRLKRDEATIQTVYQQITNRDEQISEIVTEHHAKQLQIESWLENRIHQYQKLKTLQEIINFGEVNYQKISELYDPIRTEIAEYRVVLQVLEEAHIYKSSSGDITSVLANTMDPIEQIALTKRLTDKLFFLLEKAKSHDLGNYLEKILYFLAEKETPGNPLPETERLLRLRNKFRQSIAERLGCFINEQRPEEICQQLCAKIIRNEEHSQVYNLLNYLTFDMLNEQLSECPLHSNKHFAIKCIISTKKLLELLTPTGSAVYESTVLFKDICALFDDFNKERRAIPLLMPESRSWFDATMDAINVFERCATDVDSKKNRYTATFFLKCDEDKLKPIEELKKLLEGLPLNATDMQLNEIFKKWETEFGSTIDKPRYRFFLSIVMNIYHFIENIVGGKVFETETRTLVNRLKEHTIEATSNIANENISSITRNL